MVSKEEKSYQAALQVAQQAIIRLATWLKMDFDHQPDDQSGDLDPAVKRAMEILSWENASIGALRLLFDHVNLSSEKHNEQVHYCPAIAIDAADPLIPYPQTDIPDLSSLRTEIQLVLKKLNAEDWKKFSLLSLILEKYGSCLSFGDDNVALVDRVRITGAVAAALAQSDHQEQEQNLSLVAGDLSGIQKFIYTISSEGALKSLRARSFYLELVTEEVVQQLLKTLNLPRTSIIYAGGGNLFILANSQGIGKKIEDVAQKLNQWLRKEFQSKVFLALDYQQCLAETVANSTFKDTWNEVIKKLNQRKSVKFKDQLSAVLEPRHSHEPCRVCHRDDEENLKPLSNEPDAPLACITCIQMFQLGGELFKVNSILRSRHVKTPDKEVEYVIPLRVSNHSEDNVFYYLFKDKKPTTNKSEQVLLINNWSIEDYKLPTSKEKTVPLLLGNYFQEGKDGFMRALEFAETAKSSGCISKVGYLRMDVDRLGQIFAGGLSDELYSLPRIASLSRQMSYFFKVYLNGLAKGRKKNFLKYESKFNFKSLTHGDRPNLLFIYAGGDDLFVSGAWNEVVEFAFDVYQSFRAYTGNNPDITLSGGISIDDIKFPLYQSADSSGDAESLAKGNGRDSLCLFGSALKWDEWIGSDNSAENHQKIVSIIHEDNKDYWEKAKPNVEELKLLGVLPFVKRIKSKKLQLNYSRNFVRNLLAAAQLQEQRIEEIKQKRKLLEYDDQIQDLRYYLHLPQIAYTLARLPKEVFKDDDFRKSIKHPYNAPYFRAIATWIELLTRNT